MTSPKYTADNITAEQIREVLVANQAELSSLHVTLATYLQRVRLANIVHHARVALGERRARRGGSRAKSRARIAEILNARAKAVR